MYTIYRQGIPQCQVQTLRESLNLLTLSSGVLATKKYSTGWGYQVWYNEIQVLWEVAPEVSS